MNMKRLTRSTILLLIVMIVFVGELLAQQTYFVNVKDGLDGWDGSSPVFLGPGVGPKKTMNNAILNASTGDIISVDYADGNLYNENVNLNKAVTLQSTNGTPQIVSWNVSANISVNGPFKLNTGLTLANGAVTGASNLTVGGQITRTTGTVDSQLNYTGVVNFTYNSGAAVDAGFELPPSTDVTHFGNLTTTAGTILKLYENKTMNGIMNLAGSLNLNTYTLTIVGANSPHNIAADVLGSGSFIFNLTGNIAVNGNGDLPNVTGNASSNFLLSLNTNASIGDITANSKAGIASPNSGILPETIGYVRANGSQNISFGVADNFDGLANSGTASIIVGHDNAVTIDMVDLMTGTIDISGSGTSPNTVTVNGPANFISGIWNMESTVPRTLELKGSSIKFSSTSGRTDFSSSGKVPGSDMRNVTLEYKGTVNQSVTGDQIETIWFGPMIVNNTSGMVPSVTFQGGDFRVLDDVSFVNGRVNIVEKKLLVGGRLAPFVNLPGTGNFSNVSGYSTQGNGFVSMNSNVNSNISGGGTFGNFEVDMNALNCNVLPATGPMTGQFNLAKGQVTSANNVNFNHTPPPVIVRNEGTFDVPPTFTTQVDVIYINKDKATGNELPATPAFADKLRNLSILTSNGTLVSGKGTVRVPPAAPPVTVNGTLKINGNQTLLLDGVPLFMKGSTIDLDGDIANDAAGAGILILDNPSGTTITASSTLPDLLVADGSIGNTISGSSVTFARGLLGANNLKGGGDDISPGNTGGITFVGGPVGSTLSLNLGSPNSVTNSHLDYVMTGTNATLTLLNNLVQSGDLTHMAGKIDLGSFNYTHKGTNPAFWGRTNTVGSGKLIFTGSLVNTVFTCNLVATNAPVIHAKVEVNLDIPGRLFQIDPLGTTHLWIVGDFILTRGTVQLGSAGTARNLTLRSANFEIGANGSINTIGIGTLFLDSAYPPMNVLLGGNRNLGNVTVDNDVVIDPASVGTDLDIQGLFQHNSGNLDFNSRDITVSGTFVRVNGTYAATTGYLIIQTPFFNQGVVDFSIPNLMIQAGVPFAIGNTANITVTQGFDIDNDPQPPATPPATYTIFAHTNGAPRLHLANGATFTYISGDLDVVPVYAGIINLVSAQRMNVNLPVNVWPATPTTLVKHFNEDGIPGTTVTLPGSRTINSMFTLTEGTVIVPAAANLNIANNDTINVINGVLNVAGTRTFGTNIDVYYKNDGLGAYITGPELPATVNNLTFTRIVNAANQQTNITTPVVVSGTLTIRNDVQTMAAPPVDATISTYGDVIIENESATFPAATDPTAIFNAPLEFTGADDQDLLVPAAGIDLTGGGLAAANIRINKTDPDDVVNLVGGNIRTGIVNFVNGLIVTGDNVLSIPAPLPGLGQGFDRAGVTGTNVSHVVGNVRKTLVNGGTIGTSTNERNEFPVGTDSLYRPVAITFKPAFGIPTIPNALQLTVNHMDQRPTGEVGLPITDGVEPGVDVVDYPDFYWKIYTSQNLSQYNFDLELRADGFMDYDTVSSLRIIRRHGAIVDVQNEWRLQGNSGDYDNAQYQGDPSKPTVINQNSLGGLRTEGALFTYGLKSAKQEYFEPVWDGNPFRAMTIFCTRAHINGSTIGVGDEIGVFDGNICVGAAVLDRVPTTGNPVQIICSAKEDGQNNGFTDGNPMTFLLWDKTAGIVYDATAQFYDPATNTPIAPAGFEGLGTAAVQLDDNGIHAESQTLSLNSGWNIFSLAVTPNGSIDMLDILNPVLADLDKVLDEGGNSIVKLFGNWQNSIGNWTSTEGYYIKLKNATTVSIAGNPISTPLCINVNTGWNIISYPCLQNPQDALVVFQNLINDGYLVKVIDESGNSIFKLFGNWLNSIGDLQPGKGYYVKVNTNSQVCIDCPGQGFMPKMVESTVPLKPKHFTIEDKKNPYKPMSIYLVGAEVNGVTLETGDEVAVFDGNQLVGASVVQSKLGKYEPLEIIARMSDGDNNGFREGNALTFKVWQQGMNEEADIASSEVAFIDPETGKNALPIAFKGLGTAIVEIKSDAKTTVADQLPKSFDLEQNYPNPFNPTTSISYSLPEAANVKLEVYNINGSRVRTLYNGAQSAGNHVIEWSGVDDNGMKVASGIYLYRMSAKNFVQIKKMILSK